jgi:thioredoxin reductase (NADPH)
MARAYNQAHKFGVEIAIPNEAVRLEKAEQSAGGPFLLNLSTREQVRAKAVIIATGARYRQLAVEKFEAFESSSIHYWASPLEAKLCQEQEVVLVGAGNSAGQATVYLASHAAKVWLLVRRAGLSATMSRYLVDRIERLPNVEVVTETEIAALEGEGGRLRSVSWRHGPTGIETRRSLHHLFLFIGADPNTDWLAGSPVAVDARGFVLTGSAAGSECQLESSSAGIFAIGDVRAGSVKRVAAAVGDGARVVSELHDYLSRNNHPKVLGAHAPV